MRLNYIVFSLLIAFGLGILQPYSEENKDKKDQTSLTAQAGTPDFLPSKKGEIEEADGLLSVFYYVAPEYGAAFVALLEKWKSKEGRIVYSDKLQSLVITDTKQNISIMEQIMRLSDVPSPQIIIEAQVLEKIIKSDLQLGWDSWWERPTSSKTFFRKIEEKFHPGAYLQSLSGSVGGFQGSTFSFYTTGKHGTTDIKIRTMVDRNEAVILSSPRVVVASGSKAIISSGQEVPFQQVTLVNNVATANIQYKTAEIKMEVFPTVLGGNFISLKIIPEVKTVSGYQILQGAETPVFGYRRSETTLTVRSGDTVHIGGLVREEDVVYERGIPLLADIPFLGIIFKRHQRDKNKTEIVFIIKPTIITRPEETIKPSVIKK
ncbi:MAG: hypothetical protein QME51_08905 [Planctomycetota bacterium]|nr:hypothetical protein [Planctomycetota bacterium]MDI6788475.1 hypothetical protein [Planctomycetota bacterium]